MTIPLILSLCISITTAYKVRGNPYSYQSDPMASVPVNQGNVFFNPFSRMNQNPYMVGEEFFKQEFNDVDDKTEKLPYTVIQNYGSYEKRLYPGVSLVCTYDHVDTAGDPLAGLDRLNPRVIMQSRRFNKTPQSVMFMKLFRYISGVNQRGEEIEMTKPVTTLHKIVREERIGNIELQMMCFYLPSKYQPEHSHEVAARHAAVSPPLPEEDSQIVLYNRPEMEVYVHQFGGFALTAESWEKQRQILLDDLIGKKVNQEEFFSVSYNNPLQMENRINEIWVQSMEGEPADLSSKLEELHESDSEHRGGKD